MTLYYCYDAYCGWCYGFSPVIKRIAEEYKDKINVEVLSGGMLLHEPPMKIAEIAPFIQKSYKNVENMTGAKFGEKFLEQIFNYKESNWTLQSEKPAIAMAIFKEFYRERSIEFASDLQYALNFEGKNLTEDDSYIDVVKKYDLDPQDFIVKLGSDRYRAMAHYEFQLVKQIKVESFPQVLLQVSGKQFYLVAKGYRDYDTVKKTLDMILAEVEKK